MDTLPIRQVGNRPSVRAMALQVVGAGFGRTGTLSMKTALEQLGFGPCHHMVEVFGRTDSAPVWAAAIAGEPVDLDALLEGFAAAVDFPSCAVWDRLAAHWPEAKVLLTVRSSESWWRSFEATIGPHLASMDGEMEPLMSAIRDRVFRGAPMDRDTAVAAYEQHNAAVILRTPADRLLVYEVGSGWEPLCGFLGVDVPDGPFPSSNTTEEFQARAEAEADAADG